MKTSWVLSLCVVFAAGCSGLIGGGDDDADGSEGSTPGVEGATCEGVCVGPSGLMRLTRDEYVHSVHAVFGEAAAVNPDQLPFDASAGPFAANDATVTEPKVRKPNVRARGYGENFATDRRGAWTH